MRTRDSFLSRSNVNFTSVYCEGWYTNLLTDTVRPVYEAPHAFFLANLYELFPRKSHPWVRTDRVNYSDDLVTPGVVCASSVRWCVAVIDIWLCALYLSDFGAKVVEDLRARRWEREHETRRCRPRWLGSVAEVAYRA